jgi:hypothetical protein
VSTVHGRHPLAVLHGSINDALAGAWPVPRAGKLTTSGANDAQWRSLRSVLGREPTRRSSWWTDTFQANKPTFAARARVRRVR